MGKRMEPSEEKTAASSPPFVDLTNFVSETALDDLDDYLQTHVDLLSPKVGIENGEIGLFTAKGYKHGDSIDLTDRDTSGWCADVFTAYTSQDDFKVCRAHRGDPSTWRLNDNINARLLPGLVDFLTSDLPFFEQMGKISIICNAPNSKGVEHADIDFPDLVSEFLWIRTKSSRKKFYVRDPETNEKHFVTTATTAAKKKDEEEEIQKNPVSSGCCSAAVVAWFDDHLLHNIEPSDQPSQFSIRVDGRFTTEFRKILCEKGTFRNEELRTVLAGQQDGPAFLNEYNEPPEYSDDDDDEDDDEDEDDEEQEE